MNDELAARRAKVRERQLVLALERWACGYSQVAGGWLPYLTTITAASDAEKTWLEGYVAEHGIPAGPTGMDEVWARGRKAELAATTAFLAGEWDRSRDLVDDAWAYDAVLEGEWRRLHDFITASQPVEAAPAAAPVSAVPAIVPVFVPAAPAVAPPVPASVSVAPVSAVPAPVAASAAATAVLIIGPLPAPLAAAA
ncbi:MULTISPECIES: hypothetical protein [Actinoplanes]|uniref:hypothetical protein n=1 Tax=Actinoplanes TaxID=1865 RepID=UPI0005F2C43F|nr:MULTISPECIES: hypothetical protein [Actinoplanes]GLY03871.1 hypothetical protein Acsp01_42500 [Actinoplanes sp. NBRC 101535]